MRFNKNVNKEKAKTLLERHERGDLSAEEQVRLHHWYLQETVNSREMLSDMQLKSSYHFLKANLPLAGNGKTVKLWPQLVVGLAAALALIILGTWLYDTSDTVGHTNDIAPGRNTAILTLASGQVIQLSDTKTGVVVDASNLKYSDGTSISRHPSSVGMTSVSTPRGGTYQVVLPDSTIAWLNADSKITFPSLFSGSKREVSITGEIYFEVTHNKVKPFIVKSYNQTVEVLGTHFNINAYPDEAATKTTLLEGSVRISPYTIASTHDGTILKPGEQSILNTSNQISIKTVDIHTAIDWKNGDFIFNGENIESIMRKIARWYDVEVTYTGNMPEDKLVGKVSRSKNIGQVLEALEAMHLVKLKIEGRKVTVTR